MSIYVGKYHHPLLFFSFELECDFQNEMHLICIGNILGRKVVKKKELEKQIQAPMINFLSLVFPFVLVFFISTSSWSSHFSVLSIDFCAFFSVLLDFPSLFASLFFFLTYYHLLIHFPSFLLNTTRNGSFSFIGVSFSFSFLNFYISLVLTLLGTIDRLLRFFFLSFCLE